MATDAPYSREEYSLSQYQLISRHKYVYNAAKTDVTFIH
jgi:hypothetical protein